MRGPNLLFVCAVLGITTAFAALRPAQAARPRRANTAQSRQRQGQMKYLQQDTLRYQRDVAAKEQEIFNSFDANKNGHLEGGEKARFDTYMHAVRQGREPDPFATIAPIGKGPKAGQSQSDK